MKQCYLGRKKYNEQTKIKIITVTVMCLSIGTPKNNKFSICSKRCPKIWANYSLIIMCSNIGTLNNHHFPFGTNGEVVVLGVPILKHFRVGTVF